jgi:hypothetical protein
MLPRYVEKVLTLQPDGMLLRAGWEDYINNSDCDWLSSHWRHMAGIDIFDEPSWMGFKWRTAVGNGGFSFRKASIIRQLTRDYGHLTFREAGRTDGRQPMEDLFYCFTGSLGKHMKMPTLKQCDEFSCDPLTPKIYDSPNKPFGFHYFKNLSEPDWPECNHG